MSISSFFLSQVLLPFKRSIAYLLCCFWILCTSHYNLHASVSSNSGHIVDLVSKLIDTQAERIINNHIEYDEYQKLETLLKKNPHWVEYFLMSWICGSEDRFMDRSIFTTRVENLEFYKKNIIMKKSALFTLIQTNFLSITTLVQQA